jgi:hypothetical protein
LIGWLFRWFVEWLVGLFDWLAGWLIVVRLILFIRKMFACFIELIQIT